LVTGYRTQPEDTPSSYLLLTPGYLAGHGVKQHATPGCRCQSDPVELLPAEMGLTGG